MERRDNKTTFRAERKEAEDRQTRHHRKKKREKARRLFGKCGSVNDKQRAQVITSEGRRFRVRLEPRELKDEGGKESGRRYWSEGRKEKDDKKNQWEGAERDSSHKDVANVLDCGPKDVH